MVVRIRKMRFLTSLALLGLFVLQLSGLSAEGKGSGGRPHIAPGALNESRLTFITGSGPECPAGHLRWRGGSDLVHLRHATEESETVDLLPSRSYLSNSKSSETIPSLQSKFLKDDPIARQILRGELIDYSINDFALVSGQGFVSTETFAYRVLSAIRQLGYTPPIDGGIRPGQALLNKFQKLNRLPVTEVVTKDLLLVIDGKLKETEPLDASEGPQFPLYPSLTSAIPSNEPSREHFARLLALSFKALPRQLVPYTRENFLNFYRQQLPFFVVNTSTEVDSSDAVCDINYYPQYGNDCRMRANTVITLTAGEFEVVGTLFHEYAHWLDGNLFETLPGTARGKITTLGFYSISYDISKGVVQADTRTYYPLRRGESAVATEFVGAYARGAQLLADGLPIYTPFEDFAESFGLYVNGGRIFRELAANNQYLRQKYDWLKANVFAGFEYDTGEVANIKALRGRPTATANVAFNVNDFGRIDDNHVFNYQFPRVTMPRK